MKSSRLALCASLALSLTAEGAQPAPGALGRPGVQVRLRGRGPGASPRLLLGPLTDAAPALPPRLGAERLLAELRRGAPGLVPRELAEPEVAPVGEGHVVRYAQRHRGVPVLGGEVVARVAADGRVMRLVRDVVEEAVLQDLDVRPAVSAEAARATVAALGRGRAAPPALQIDLETGRVVWVVPSADPARLENALYLVDAATGALLRRIERLWFADQFHVYRANPAVQAAGQTAPLPGGEGGPFSPAAATPRTLSSPLLRATNCIDEGTARELPGLPTPAHLCVPRQTAVADDDGDFDGLEPLVGEQDGRCPTARDRNLNQFAEAHMYWHAAAIYERFRALYAGLGRPDFRLHLSTGRDPQPLAMVVNLCVPDFADAADVSKPLRPLENAFFSPGGLGGFNEVLTGHATDALGFGMGRRANFALDGDVIYHEFTHAVVYSRGRLTSSLTEDEHGLSTDPGALNEGLADYFSSTLAGDPEVGEYAWRNFSTRGSGLRSLDNDDHCSDDRMGEIHEDSTPFSGALWAARRAIAGEPGAGGPAAARRDLFDQAVLAALEGSGSRPSMTDMAELVVQEVGMRAQLGQDAAERARQAFAAHGVLPRCDRVIRKLAPKAVLCLDGIEGRGRKLMAGHVQWRIEVPETADTLTVRLDSSAGGCSGGYGASPPAARLRLAVRAADEPLTWDRAEGSQDELVDLGGSGGRWEGKVPVKRGVYHVMIVNAGGSAVGRNIRFALGCEAPAGCKAPEPVRPEPPPGCGCRIGGQPTAGAGLAHVLLLLTPLGFLGRVRRRLRGATSRRACREACSCRR